MNIFLSYASDYRRIADDMCCRLQAVGHDVFFDREDLPAGASFDDRIRQAIDDCELFIFLVSPAAVADGHYTRTELKLASRKWPTPGWHVLPVMVAPTPLDTIPPYLRALTLMQAEGNLTAEVVFEVEERVRRHSATPAPSAPPPAAADPDSVRPEQELESAVAALSTVLRDGTPDWARKAVRRAKAQTGGEPRSGP